MRSESQPSGLETPADFDDLISALNQQHADAQTELDRLNESRRCYALDAARNNPAAKQAIESIEAEMCPISTRLQTLSLAMEETQKARSAKQSDNEARELKLSREKADALAGEILGIDVEIDNAAAQLGLALAKRDQPRALRPEHCTFRRNQSIAAQAKSDRSPVLRRNRSLCRLDAPHAYGSPFPP